MPGVEAGERPGEGNRVAARDLDLRHHKLPCAAGVGRYLRAFGAAFFAGFFAAGFLAAGFLAAGFFAAGFFAAGFPAGFFEEAFFAGEDFAALPLFAAGLVWDVDFAGAAAR